MIEQKPRATMCRALVERYSPPPNTALLQTLAITGW